MDIEKIKLFTWNNNWAGRWCVLTCSHFSDEYTKEIRFGKRPFVYDSIILVFKGRSQGWVKQDDRDNVGKFLSDEVLKNPGKVKEVCASLKKETDRMLNFISNHEKENITEVVYREFWRTVPIYYKEHINIKYVVDYLPPDELAKYLSDFEEARLYAERVLERVEDFTRTFARQLSKKFGYGFESLLCLVKEEVFEYFSTGNFPAENILQNRYDFFAIVSDEQGKEYFGYDEAKRIEQTIIKVDDVNTIKGTTAYPGQVKGKVKVVVGDPKNAVGFNEGDILVTGMTRPEFLPLMKKSAAIVTDSGGVLSHAAIVARELKKPCIIGTKIATKVLKDGDIVDVDAERGIVRKIN